MDGFSNNDAEFQAKYSFERQPIDIKPKDLLVKPLSDIQYMGVKRGCASSLGGALAVFIFLAIVDAIGFYLYFTYDGWSLLGIIIFTVILVLVMIACLLDAIPPKQGAVFKVTQVNRKMINNVESKYVNAINEQNMQALYGVQYTSNIPVQAGDYVIIAHPFASKSKVKAYPSR